MSTREDQYHREEEDEIVEEVEDLDPDGEREDEDEELEYESWAVVGESTFHLKLLVIGLVILGFAGIGAIVFATALNDPAAKFDNAPIVNMPSEGTPLAVTGTEDRSLEVKMPEDRPRSAKPVEASAPSPSPTIEEPTEKPIQQETQTDDGPTYSEILAQAKQERRAKHKKELLREAITINPAGDEALATLAMMLMERGNTRAEALELASRAVEANPDNGLGWLVIGYVKQLVGKTAEARQAYRKCAGCSGPKRFVSECRRLG